MKTLTVLAASLTIGAAWVAGPSASGHAWAQACDGPQACWEAARAADQGSDHALRLYGDACDGGLDAACWARASLEPDPARAARYYAALCQGGAARACEEAARLRCEDDARACEAACAGDGPQAAPTCWALAQAREPLDGITAAIAPLRRACALGHARGCERAAELLSHQAPDADPIEARALAHQAISRYSAACAQARDARACDAALALAARFGLPSAPAVMRAACALGVAFDCPKDP
jgi:hypothetical protein